MDERKKSIRELEEKKRETREKTAKLLGTWGEAVLSRPDTEGLPWFSGKLGQYRHFLETLALCRESIRTLEDGALRLRDLKKKLEELDKIAAQKTEALEALYISLGETALQNDGVFTVEASLKTQADTLTARIGERQEKLAELEEGRNANIFAWIGGSAQGALIRSRLAKSRAGLNRAYAATGEQVFTAHEWQGHDGGQVPAGDIPAHIGALRQELAALEESRSSLKDEWGALRESLGAGGNSRSFNPAKRIRELEQRIAREQEGLSEFCGAFGNQLYDLFADSEAGEDTGESAWLQEEDKNILARARKMREELAGQEAGIAKLRASLQIDERRDSIDKMKRSILSHRQRIAASEGAIAGLEKQIEESNRHIEELMKL